jgi:hypothetical protein
VSFADASSGLAVGDDGAILRTADGGNTWRCESGGVQTDVNAVEFIDDANAIAVGDGGVLLRWKDGPATPVLITAFQAHAVENGIELNWRLLTDELIDAISVYRSAVTDDSEILLTPHPLPGAAQSYIDLTAVTGVRYRYVLVVTGRHAGDIRSAPVEAERVPLVAQLFQNRPNPFNPTTTIRYSVADKSHASLTIYSTSGERVRTLVEEIVPAGIREAIWDGKNDNGRPVATGVYIYRLRTGGETLSKKMVLLK